jgi:hypothetical protein
MTLADFLTVFVRTRPILATVYVWEEKVGSGLSGWLSSSSVVAGELLSCKPMLWVLAYG